MISICRNCGVAFAGNYCNNCGEKKFNNKDRTVWHVLKEGLHFVTHLEGTFFVTLKTILRKPGQFASDFCNGKRKSYFKPLALFLLLIVLYLMFPYFQGLNMSLKYHMQHRMHSEYATKKVNEVLGSYPNFEALSDAFHHKAEKISKFLLFIMIPVMALFSKLVLFRKKMLYYDHFIFATEEFCVFILWGFLILPLITMLLATVLPRSFFQGELLIGILLGVGFAAHVALAARKFFKLHWVYNILFTAAYIFFTFFFLENIYKFILFYITIHLMH